LGGFERRNKGAIDARDETYGPQRMDVWMRFVVLISSIHLSPSVKTFTMVEKILLVALLELPIPWSKDIPYLYMLFLTGRYIVRVS
jgi:hypothetical protein